MGRLSQFLRVGIWQRDLRELPWFRRALFGVLRVILHVVQNFDRHMVGARAGALTMTTLLAVVPLAAMTFSVANGFGFGGALDRMLLEFSEDLPAQLKSVVNQVRDLVAAIDFRQLGVVSSLVVLYTGLSLFVRTERALNRAWESSAQRSWLRRFSDFVALVILVPALGAAAMTMSSLLNSADVVASWRETSPWLGWLYEAGLGFIPYVMLGCAMTALYKFMPSARVRWRPALIGGFVAGVALLWMNALYIHFQIGVAQNNAIYATIAALPLLIVYVHIAWLIVLAGAELSHAVQHVSLLGGGHSLREPSPVLRERLALALTERAVASFDEGHGGLPLGEAATDLDVPRPVVESVCEDLESATILARVDEELVLPARPGEQISLADVRLAIRGVLPSDLRERLELDATLERVLVGADDAQQRALRVARFSASA